MFFHYRTARSIRAGFEAPYVPGKTLTRLACQCEHMMISMRDFFLGGRWDMQALSMAHCIGRPHQAVPVYRLVTKGTMEERVHQLVDKKKGSELIFKSSVRWDCLPGFLPGRLYCITCFIALPAPVRVLHLLCCSTCCIARHLLVA